MKSKLLLLVLLATAPAMAAQVYTWVDANGVKHFSDSPPPPSVAKSQKIKVQGQLTTATADAPAAADATKDEAGKSNGPALAAAAGYTAEDIKRNCEIARNNVTIIEKQVIRMDDKGNPVDPEQVKSHEAQLDKANQQIKLFCSGS